MAHGDYNAYEKKIIQKYQLTKVFGVTSLLTDIHDLREQRFRGTDTTFLSCVLMDFERILQSVRLTERQAQALWFRYELDLSQGEIAELMGISQQAVSKHIDNAVAKIVIKAKEEENKRENTL